MPTAAFILNASPGQLLEASVRDLSPLLSIDAGVRLKKAALALRLSARTLCLECRLDDDARVDLALCLATHTVGLADELQALGRDNADDPEWRRCTRLLQTWARGADSTLARVPFLYTAFDLGASGARLPVPCLSLCVDASFFLRRVGLPAACAEPDAALQLLAACGAQLEADWLTASVRERARRCVEAVDELEVRQLSLMLARRPVSVKLDLTLPVARLEPFLTATGWQGDRSQLSRELRLLAPWQERAQLNYVVDGSPRAPLEVELCCTGSSEPSSAERSSLLQALVSRGLARAPKAAVLAELLTRPVVTDANGLWVARNWYLKLRFEDGRFCAAKVYIGLMQRSRHSGEEHLPAVANGS
jgi:hypothetical protein